MTKTGLLTAFGALLVAAPAHAATASVDVRQCPSCMALVHFVAAPGERNVLSVTGGTEAIVLRDAGAPITPGPGCEAVEGGVRCAGNSVSAKLGDGDDVATVDGWGNGGPGAAIYGEAGDDRISGDQGIFSGGPGDDVVTGRVLRDDDGRTPGHDTYIGRSQQFNTGVIGATLRYDSRQDSVRVDLRSPANSEDRITGVSTVFGGAGDDVLMGDDQANELYGGKGDDRVLGRGGDDRVEGDTVDAGAGDDEVLGGNGSVAPRCGAGQDVVLTTGKSLVGDDCERIGSRGSVLAEPRLRLRSADRAFLREMRPCTSAGLCTFNGWKATYRGRVVAAGEATARSLKLNPLGRRLLRRDRTLRLRVTHTTTLTPIEGGEQLRAYDRFRLDLRLP